MSELVAISFVCLSALFLCSGMENKRWSLENKKMADMMRKRGMFGTARIYEHNCNGYMTVASAQLGISVIILMMALVSFK